MNHELFNKINGYLEGVSNLITTSEDVMGTNISL